MGRDRAAWDAYWVAFGVFAAVFVAFAIARGGGTFWGVIVAAPLLASGVNLVGRSDSHERICAIEVGRHRWLRLLTMGGYSRRTFFATGLAEIALAVFLLVWIAAR